MTVSELTRETIYAQLRIEPSDVDEAEAAYIEALVTAAIRYAKDYTGLPEGELDKYEDITVAVLVLVTDMYDHRLMYEDKNYANRTVETILDMHRMNLIARGGTS